jgi:ATP-dependent DNA helicase RecG
LAEFLDTPIEYLKGVGPARSELLKKELAIHTFADLLITFPFRYIDRTQFTLISDIREEGVFVQIKARLVRTQLIGTKYHERLVAAVADESGEIELVWFQGIKWATEMLSPRQEYIIFGRPALFNGRWNIPHPEMEIPSGQPIALHDIIRPVYNSTEKLKAKGLDSRGIARLVKSLLLHERLKIGENLTEEILSQLRLINRHEAFLNIHFPRSPELLKKAETRMKFEELFFLQLRLFKYRANRDLNVIGHPFSQVGDYLNKFYHQHLTFELTRAQKKVIREIRRDMGSGKQMNRLLQGDVGSGKTLVALMTMLIALDNQYQACLMAPTEILARQHYSTISRMVEGLGVEIRLLTGGTRPSERRNLFLALAKGEIQILIGTHALLEEEVQFHKLGLVVIDEQHRFGVAQRARLWEKNKITPHVLVMTATPIPRTLAMTLYGDLDTSVIDELPPGRKPIVTRHVYDVHHGKILEFVSAKIAEGRQVYIVYPMIRESEKLDLKNLEDGYRMVMEAFPEPSYHVGMLHGKMKQQEKEAAMKRFVDKTTQILVSTTVIEVGVDVPNASVMVIENADRFGLSQLHQLRGRVGRGADQSFCILVTGYALSADARVRMETMVATNDGFRIAEADLRLRGPGDIQGTQQSGMLDLRIADIVRDEKMLKYARNLASDIIHADPELSMPKNAILAHQIAVIDSRHQNWAVIS